MKKFQKKINSRLSATDNLNIFKKELGFEVEKFIIRDVKRNRYVIVGDINKRKVLVKVADKRDVKKSNGFYKEAMVDNILEKHNQELDNPLVVKARVLSVGQNNKVAWIVRRYYPGKTLAGYQKFDKDPLHGYDIINKNYLRHYKTIISKIIDNLESLQSVTRDFRKLGVEKKSIKNRYDFDIRKLDLGQVEKYYNIKIDEQIKFYEKNIKKYLENESLSATLGDLNPANIIIKDNNDVVFSDFEWFCFDNNTFDLAFLWLFLWRYPKWQKILIKEIDKLKHGKENFRASIIRIIIGYGHFVNIQKKKHIWIKYLKAAGESFSALIKVK